MRHNWLASLNNYVDSKKKLKKFCRLKVLLIQFFPVALLVFFLLVYAKCIFNSVRKHAKLCNLRHLKPILLNTLDVFSVHFSVIIGTSFWSSVKISRSIRKLRESKMFLLSGCGSFHGNFQNVRNTLK